MTAVGVLQRGVQKGWQQELLGAETSGAMFHGDEMFHKENFAEADFEELCAESRSAEPEVLTGCSCDLL